MITDTKHEDKLFDKKPQIEEKVKKEYLIVLACKRDEVISIGPCGMGPDTLLIELL